MTDLVFVFAVAGGATALALAAAFAAGWRAAGRSGARRVAAAPPCREGPAVELRICVADLRARMRRLEAIAAGIDV